jgi:hypothetical protein
VGNACWDERTAKVMDRYGAVYRRLMVFLSGWMDG